MKTNETEQTPPPTKPQPETKGQQDNDEAVIRQKVQCGLTREQALGVIQRQRRYDASKQKPAKS